MARSKTGEAISVRGRSPSGRKQLRRFIRAAEQAQDLGRTSGCTLWSWSSRFFHTTDERDAALVATFERLDAHPALTAGQVARFFG